MNVTTVCITAAALADPTRIRMLLSLDGKAVAVGELAAAVGVVPSVGTHHTRILEDAGFVVTRYRGRRKMVRRVEARWRQVLDGLGGP